MNLLGAVLASLTLALGGVGLLRLLWPSIRDVPGSARLALGFCAGSSLVTGVFFLAYVLGIEFSRPLVLVPVLVLAVVGAVTTWRGGFRRPRFDFVVVAAAVLLVLALALSWSRPVYGYDALSMWALKAKVAFHARTWPPTLFDRYTTHHPEYPPLIPSVQAFIFFWLNRFDDVASRTVFAAFFASGAAILWWWLTALRVSARGLWLLWWCALPVMMEQVKITYADLPLAVFLVVFFGAILRWWREPQQPHWGYLAALSGGLAFWVKQDALIGVGGGWCALLLVLAGRRVRGRAAAETHSASGRRRGFNFGTVLGAAALTAVVAAPWRLLVWWKQLPGDFAVPAAPVADRALVVFRELARYAFVEGGHAFFWPLFVVTLCFCGRRLRKTENLWLFLAVIAGNGIILAAYLFSTLDLEAQLKTSADRLLISLFVPALLLVALLWRSSWTMLRPHRWQRAIPVVMALVVLAAAWTGLHRKSDEELAGVTISPFPSLLSWVWLVAAAMTILTFFFRMRHRGVGLVWRAVQFACALAVFGLAIVSMGVYAREWGELRRRFGRKTLAEQHMMALDPLVRQKLDAALKEFPAGTRVRLTPKRSLRYHQFYYEVVPRLVVDDRAEHTVILEPNQ